jgi:hypothetical protein
MADFDDTCAPYRAPRPFRQHSLDRRAEVMLEIERLVLCRSHANDTQSTPTVSPREQRWHEIPHVRVVFTKEGGVDKSLEFAAKRFVRSYRYARHRRCVSRHLATQVAHLALGFLARIGAVHPLRRRADGESIARRCT